MPKKKIVPKKTDKKKKAKPTKAAKPAKAAKAAKPAKATKPATATKTTKAASASRLVARAPKAAPRRTSAKKTRTRSGGGNPAGPIEIRGKGLGAEAAGQSGDIEGLSGTAQADSESVEELAEEGQAFEAEAVSGVEDALDPDEAEVTTHEVPEDDVPEEYDDEEQ